MRLQNAHLTQSVRLAHPTLFSLVQSSTGEPGSLALPHAWNQCKTHRLVQTVWFNQDSMMQLRDYSYLTIPLSISPHFYYK